MTRRRTLGVLAGAVSVALVAAGCGGGDSGSSNSAASQGADSRGPITYVQGKDNSNILAPMAEK
jgi:multiple sugar transport system substrate-binding protein